jgi:hypothetical protein
MLIWLFSRGISLQQLSQFIDNGQGVSTEQEAVKWLV